MEKKSQSTKPGNLIVLLAAFLLFSAFVQPTPTIGVSTTPKTLSPTSAPTKIELAPTPQGNPLVENDLIPIQTFDDPSSPFCQSPVDLIKTNGLTHTCSNGKFSFLTSPKAKDHYKYILVTQPIQPSAFFSIEADLVSQPVTGKPDQNNYGLVLGIDSTHTYTLRFKGQQYRFEQNLLTRITKAAEDEIHIVKSWNWNYSPFLKSVGKSNHIQLTCGERNCDLNINQSLAARFNLNEEIKLSSISLFAEIEYYKPFGSVDIDNLHAYIPQDKTALQNGFVLSDPLVSDLGNFPKTGLSGAFNKYLADGFHFSSVVPFGYIGVKTEPALGDVSISASVVLKPDNIKSSMYAGLICRSSMEGMYFAAIRESGVFSVFRDSPNLPLTLLAQTKSKAILTGGAINQLRLDCVGSTISFYINGKQVANLQDDTYKLVFGRSGFFTKAGKNPEEENIAYSNLEIKEVR